MRSCHFLSKVNPSYVKQFEENGMQFVGRDVEGERMEIMEIKGILAVRMVCSVPDKQRVLCQNTG